MSEEEDQNEPQKKALLTLSIELGDKKKQLLNIYLDSKPEQLAYDFCLQNNLDFDSMQNLTEEIKNALSNYKADSNQESKIPISEEVEQNSPKEKEEKGEKDENEENNGNIENKENENKYKTEEVEEEHEQEEHEHEQEEHEHEQEEHEHEQEEHEHEQEEHKHEQEEHEHEQEEHEQEDHEHEQEEHEHEQEDHEIQSNEDMNNNEHEEEHIEKEEKEEDVENKEEKEEKAESNDVEENNQEENLSHNEKEKEKTGGKLEEKEETEEDLVKEEERDKVLDQNNEKEEIENNEENNEEKEENENEEDEDLPSYLSPTICFQNKQRQAAKAKPKPEFTDFDTRYKKVDKLEEFNKEKNEEVINHLIINLDNQKYLPKDYYDNPENKNFGERLYNREKIMKEDAMKKAKLKAKLENKNLEENMTFIPKINDYNLIALQNRKLNKMQFNEEKRILNYKDYLEEKEKNTKNKHFADIEKENTFAPKINKNSEKMAGNRSLQIPRYEQLYKRKYDIKKLENKIYDNKNMFKPKINKNYKTVKTDNNKMKDYSNLTFEERQKKFLERTEAKKEKLTEIKNSNVDQRTGKKFFKPTINRNKKLDIERKNKKVFNELYRDSAKYQIKKEELVKKIAELEQGLY